MPNSSKRRTNMAPTRRICLILTMTLVLLVILNLKRPNRAPSVWWCVRTIQLPDRRDMPTCLAQSLSRMDSWMEDLNGIYKGSCSVSKKQ